MINNQLKFQFGNVPHTSKRPHFPNNRKKDEFQTRMVPIQHESSAKLIKIDLANVLFKKNFHLSYSAHVVISKLYIPNKAVSNNCNLRS